MLNIPSHHFLKLYWLVILGTSDFPCTSLITSFMFSVLSNSWSVRPLQLQSLNTDTCLFYITQSLQTISFTTIIVLTITRVLTSPKPVTLALTMIFRLVICLLDISTSDDPQAPKLNLTYMLNLPPGPNMVFTSVQFPWSNFGKLFQTLPSPNHIQSLSPINFTA